MRFAELRFTASLAAVGAALLAGIAAAPAHADTRFIVRNLVSDGFVPAHTIDPNLVNPWGMSYFPTGPFWVSANGADVSTLYNGHGGIVPLVVSIASGAPTGQVFSGNPGSFVVNNGSSSGHAFFLFASENGSISGWSPTVDFTHSILAVDNTNAGDVYKGLALGTSGGSDFLYAADFHHDEVQMYDSNFGLVKTFTDPSVAAGFAPFNVQNLGGELYVTYALQDSAGHDDVAGPGNGYVDVFNLDGTFNRRLVSMGGAVNSPWGLAIAPTSFGTFAGDLLVGNFGDGTISAFNSTTGAFEGVLRDKAGNPIVEGDLWGLIPGNDALAGKSSRIYFTAGLLDEAHGLFGSITAVPEPAAWTLMLIGFGGLGIALRSRRRGLPAPAWSAAA